MPSKLCVAPSGIFLTPWQRQPGVEEELEMLQSFPQIGVVDSKGPIGDERIL